MNKTMEILNPARAVKLSGREVKVKELNWREAMEFLGKLSQYAGGFMTGDGKFVVETSAVVALVLNAKELADFLLMKTTGLTQEEVDALSLSEVLSLLDAAIELNLSPELLARGKSVAGRVGAAFGANKKSPEPISAT